MRLEPSSRGLARPDTVCMRLAPVLLLFLGACGVRDLSAVTPELAEGAPKGRTEMVFALRDYARHADGRQTVSLVATDGGVPVLSVSPCVRACLL